MATASVISSAAATNFAPQGHSSTNVATYSRHGDVESFLNYHKPNEDGSPPHPTYVDRPETYDRPFESHKVVVHDVRGNEDKFTLDRNGFQFYKHSALEEDFLDDAQIKDGYYKETEQLLKEASVMPRIIVLIQLVDLGEQYWSFQNLHLRPYYPSPASWKPGCRGSSQPASPRARSTRPHRPVL
jgi:hypothetical protein